MTVLDSLYKHKIVAIIRGLSEEQAHFAADALYEGGIRLIEVTMNTPHATRIMAQWISKYDRKLHAGAGTVIDRQMAVEAIDAGASFLVSPNLDEEVIAYAASHQVDVWPGVMTPTEIVKAWRAGAKAVKVFPMASLGLSYFKEIRAPLDHIPMMATGGVTLDNIEDFFQAGAAAVGVGSSLLPKEYITEMNHAALVKHANAFVKKAQDYTEHSKLLG